MGFWDPRGRGGRPWIVAALLGVALLILPALAWIAVPRSGHFVAPAPPRRWALASPSGEAASESDSDDEADAQVAAPDAGAAAEAPDDGVSGVVVDPAGNPIDDARVACVDHPELAATTRDGGRFRLEPAADGCRAIARHAEFAPSRQERLDRGRANEVRLEAGGSIEGVVVDERGSGVTPVMVAIESYVAAGGVADAPEPSRSAKSFDSRNGSFAIGKLAPGRYVLTASAEQRPPAHSDAIDVEAGRVARGVKIVLPHGGRLVGLVLDRATKKSIAGALVSLDRSTPAEVSEVQSVSTDDRGRFTLEGAPLGPFSIRVYHPKYKAKIVSSLTSSPSGAPADVVIDLAPRGDGEADTEMSGIGAQIAPLGDAVRVVGLLPNSPAGEAGVRRGDDIIKIDGVDARSLSIDEAMQRLRGAAGSRVVVVVRRADGPVEIAITRGEL